jgi:hypothetical protein
MFNLISNNQVILGPMEWRKTFFENALMDELEISHTLPLNNTGTYYVVDTTTRFVPVEFTPNPEYNPKIQFLHGPFWDIRANKCVGSYVVENYTVEAVKNMLKEKLADMRWKFESKGVIVTIQGVDLFVTTARVERDIYAQAFQLGSNGATWKFGDKWIVLSNAELGTIVQAIMTHVQNAFLIESNKVVEINDATTLPQLDAITFTELELPKPQGFGVV